MSRGRGRGRGRSMGNLDALQLLPGEPPPPPTLQPPPLFPQLERRPLDLALDKNEAEVTDYLLRIKQELRQWMNQSPFYLKTSSEKNDVVRRYSDKYKKDKSDKRDLVLEWEPDWLFFPEELHLQVKRRKRQLSGSQFKPNVLAKRPKKDGAVETSRSEAPGESPQTTDAAQLSQKLKKVTFSVDQPKQLSDRLSQLEKKEELAEGVDDSGGEDELEEDYYDEELEEETDYNVSYFDNGEDYVADDEDALDEGAYY